MLSVNVYSSLPKFVPFIQEREHIIITIKFLNKLPTFILENTESYSVS